MDSRPSDQHEILTTGDAFTQNLRRGHYDIATNAPSTTEFESHSMSWRPPSDPPREDNQPCHAITQRNRAVRTAWRYRTVQIRTGRQVLTAADPLPRDLRDALALIN